MPPCRAFWISLWGSPPLLPKLMYYLFVPKTPGWMVWWYLWATKIWNSQVGTCDFTGVDSSAKRSAALQWVPLYFTTFLKLAFWLQCICFARMHPWLMMLSLHWGTIREGLWCIAERGLPPSCNSMQLERQFASRSVTWNCHRFLWLWTLVQTLQRADLLCRGECTFGKSVTLMKANPLCCLHVVMGIPPSRRSTFALFSPFIVLAPHSFVPPIFQATSLPGFSFMRKKKKT